MNLGVPFPVENDAFLQSVCVADFVIDTGPLSRQIGKQEFTRRDLVENPVRDDVVVFNFVGPRALMPNFLETASTLSKTALCTGCAVSICIMINAVSGVYLLCSVSPAVGRAFSSVEISSLSSNTFL
jgi:hypothetical protein